MLLKTNSNYQEISRKKEELEKTIKLALSEHFKTTNYPLEVISEILDENFILSNPQYYLYYPYLFNNYFGIRDTKTLNLISISGFLYYKSIILIDDVFDNKNSNNKFQKYFIANICQEETVKILSSFFDKDSSFWNTWNTRKFEYAKAYKLDKTLKNIKTYAEFEDLADYKSAFGKIAIDCLYHLSNKKNEFVYTSLLKSHKFFYAGFQIIDDVNDYVEDAQNGQFNISKHELIKTLSKENNSIESYSIKEQKKLIYLNKVSENLYIKAINYLDKATNLIASFDDTNKCFWINEIDNLHNTSISHILNINGFIEVYKTKTVNSFSNNHSINDVINNAINYLKTTQQTEGNWNDVFNDAGISDVWTSSYTIYSLLKCKVDGFNLEKAKDFISKNRLPNNLWGYNKPWISDADSTSFALLSLKKEVNIQKSFKKWLGFQNEDGGYTTYNDKNILLSSLNSPNMENVDGWLQSHFCVSAVAYLVFIELKITDTKNFKELRNYLITKFNFSEKHLSYWWADDIYAINYILQGAIKIKDEQIISFCENFVEKIININRHNYFFKGLLLHTLCLTSNLFNKYNEIVKGLAQKITSNQYNNGSWIEGHSLRIPHPSVLNPNKENIVWKEGNRGTNIIVKDYNRVFTTVSCLSALKIYEKRI